MNDDELRNALRAAVPEPPDGSGWAGRARDRAGRVTRTRTAGVLVTLLAMVGAVLWWPSLGGSPRTAVPAEQPTTASQPDNPDCSAGLTGEVTLRPRGEVQVSRVSLCPRADGRTFTTPKDSLTGGATNEPTTIFDAVLALPAEGKRDPDCSRADDRRYLMVFTLADGSRQILEAATANACGTTPMSANGRRWAGLLRLVEAAWATQRRGLPVPAAAAPCVPFDRPGLLTPIVDRIRAARLCVTDPKTGAVLGSATVSPDQLVTLKADLAAHIAQGANIDSRPDGTVITLTGAWGDPLVFWRVEGNQWFAFDSEAPDGQLFWAPDSAAADAVDGLLNQISNSAPPASRSPSAVVPRPSSPGSPSAVPAPVLPDACRGLKPSSSPAQVPATASRLRLCPTGLYTNIAFAPLDTVDGDRAIAVLQVLSVQPRLSDQKPCVEDLGRDLLLVAETDGQAPTVMVLQLYGCRVAGILDAPQGGADLVLAAFKEQLSAQRAASPTIWQRPGTLCGLWNMPAESVISVDPASVTGGRLCVYPSDSEVASREVTLTEALAKRLATDLSNSSEPTTVPCPVGPTVRRLALTNAYGDVLLIAESCLGWGYNDGNTERNWTPSAAVAAELNELG